MPISIGLKTDTHLFICSETTLSSNIVKLKEDNDCVLNISGNLACITGKQGDSFRISSFLEQYSKLLSLKYKERIGPELLANILSTEVHESLRNKRIEVQGIVGGRDEDNKLRLYGIDMYGAKHEDNFIATGYGLYFVYGIYDMMYRKDMNEEEGLLLLQKCLMVIKERLVLETDKWKIDIIGPEGIRSDVVDISK
jgi:20S proteasome subunit beta 4